MIDVDKILAEAVDFDDAATGGKAKDLSIAYMTDVEKKWQRAITAILINKSGKWGPYKHAKYAKRFQRFTLKIVPTAIDPEFTAAVNFEGNTIYVSQGFLRDEKKLYQLNVIIRHELAHVLLMHEIRMAAEIGKELYDKVGKSAQFHSLINIIADFEISNKKYTAEDKDTISHLYLNGKEIKGLVTEMHREDWLELPLEEMYHKLTDEYERIKADFSNEYAIPDYTTSGILLRKNDMITSELYSIYQDMGNKSDPSTIWLPMDEYFAKSKQFHKLSAEIQKVILNYYNCLKDFDESTLNNLLDKIVSSGLADPIEISKDIILYTPEDKFWANQVLKSLLGNARPRPVLKIGRAEHSEAYKKAYNQIIDWLGHGGITDEELASLQADLLTELFPEDTDVIE